MNSLLTEEILRYVFVVSIFLLFAQPPDISPVLVSFSMTQTKILPVGQEFSYGMFSTACCRANVNVISRRASDIKSCFIPLRSDSAQGFGGTESRTWGAAVKHHHDAVLKFELTVDIFQ